MTVKENEKVKDRTYKQETSIILRLLVYKKLWSLRNRKIENVTSDFILKYHFAVYFNTSLAEYLVRYTFNCHCGVPFILFCCCHCISIYFCSTFFFSMYLFSFTIVCELVVLWCGALMFSYIFVFYFHVRLP